MMGREDFSVELAGHTLEYIDDVHIYLVDGIQVPSVTQVVGAMFEDKYKDIPADVLKRAADAGTELHKSIEDFVNEGIESENREFKHFKFLMNQFSFAPLRSEIPVIVFFGDNPYCAGRFDLLIQGEYGQGVGIADIKRTSVLDKKYLYYQLNMYAEGYKQCYGGEIDFLKGIHIREDVRHYVSIPMDSRATFDAIRAYETKKIERLGTKA